MSAEGFPRDWFAHEIYTPRRVENIPVYVWEGGNRMGTYVAFHVLSDSHAALMMALEPQLAPAIKRHIKKGKFGEWRLIGVDRQSTKAQIFKAQLCVDGENMS